MPRSRLILCLVYALIALVALVATWHQNLSYFRAGESVLGFVFATGRFWRETFATPASTSITADLGLLLLPLCVLMIIEARRLGVRFVWLYIIGGLLVAISVTFPLFLIARERRLAVRNEADDQLGLTRGDLRGLLALVAAAAVLVVLTLLR